MFKYHLTISLLVLSTLGLAQNSNLDYKYGLKVYNLTSFEENTTLTALGPLSGSSSEYTEKSLQILSPTVAFQWKSKKNNFHEVELTSLRLRKQSTKTDIINDPAWNNNPHTINGSNVTQVDISMRYEFILNLNKSKDRKLMPSVGFGVNPYYNQTNWVPQTANFFPTSDKYIGIKGYLIPRLTYYLNSKIFLDLNLPFTIFDSYLLNSNRSDPTLPVGEQTATTINFKQFPKQFSGRIGVGLKL